MPTFVVERKCDVLSRISGNREVRQTGSNLGNMGRRSTTVEKPLAHQNTHTGGIDKAHIRHRGIGPPAIVAPFPSSGC